jgi:23S rRNA (cytidine2498-2'-O)-methyltransferase
MTSQFLFTVCQAGAEAALKKEIAREHPGFRFAFSRPGFVTFKSEEPLAPDFQLKSVFARAYGLSLSKGPLKDLPKLVSDAATLLKASSQEKKLRLHVFERDQHKPGEEPKGYIRGLWKHAALMALKKLPSDILELFSKPFEKDDETRLDDRVLDIIVVEEDQVWIGAHQHTFHHSAWPGGNPEIELPEEAPSRAYLKLEEALLWSRAPIQSGDIAVEIGSAPGGASYALLKRGLNVVGVDPGEMDRRVLAFGQNRFIHVPQPVASVRREDLPDSVQWLLLDMNVAPNITLFQIDRLASRMQDSLLGVLLTVKLNEWKIADQIPSMLDHLKAMGMARVRATQLASNKQEVFLYGLTRKGLARPVR